MMKLADHAAAEMSNIDNILNLFYIHVTLVFKAHYHLMRFEVWGSCAFGATSYFEFNI
jgi:hypothetical protein